MKIRALPAILALVLVFSSLFAFTAFSAQTRPTQKSVTQRVTDIRMEYGVNVIDGHAPDRGRMDLIKESYDDSGLDQSVLRELSDPSDFEANLAQLETALSMMGGIFTRKLAASSSDGLDVYMQFGRSSRVEGIHGAAYETNIGGHRSMWITLRGGLGKVMSAEYMIHEFGHCLEFALSDDPPYDLTSATSAVFRRALYTGVSSAANIASQEPERFASKRAEMSGREDYAECFRFAVFGGSQAPIQYGASTERYKKTNAVLDDMVELVGYRSRATQRVAYYLGLDVPESALQQASNT